MDGLFVNIYNDTSNSYSVDLETLIILSIYKLVNTEKVRLYVKCQTEQCGVKISVDLSEITYKTLNEFRELTSCCVWPVIVSDNNVIAGLCSVARFLVKQSDKSHVTALLGFRQACLLACSESSVWTRFCEVDTISTTKKLLRNEFYVDEKFVIPKNVARFEFHLSQPVRMHNVYKTARRLNNDKGLKSNVPVAELNLTHAYGEGTEMTLSDVILFPCYKILAETAPAGLRDKIPLTIEWGQRIERFGVPVLKFRVPKTERNVKVIVEPQFVKHSLYNADPARYRPEKRIYTKQDDIETALKAVGALQGEIRNDLTPYGHEIDLNWSEIPPEATALPQKRLERKREQLENLVKAVIKIVGSKRYRIVDFCSGTGHLGILLSVLLPNCNIILVENKEQSLLRAREQISKLSLTNVVTVQSNIDYFNGNFDLGVTLHACGVATDLVVQNCVENGAHFVVCPCCYGGIKDCHRLTYPRSESFRKLNLSLKSYLSLAHAADQTHDEDNVKTGQGFLSMDIVDTDRKLFAESCDYEVHLGKLQPPSCTNKNNLLVGLRKGKE